MIRSLLLKLGMLAVTIGALFWIAWQAPDSLSIKTSSVDDPLTEPVPSPVAFEVEPRPPAQADQKLMPAQSRAVKSGERTGRPATYRVVDLNRATAQELESLPGIGAVLAERVIAYRKSVGRFRTVEDLREVAGIGAKKFDRLKPLVTVAAAEPKNNTEKRSL